jgi:N-acetylglucosaminyldiphosphoundecaprenol N-acetyl-beta-D-mannosaminyltransferase
MATLSRTPAAVPAPAQPLTDAPGLLPGARDRIELLGMRIDRVTEAESVDIIVGRAAAGRGGWVITPNLDHLRVFQRSKETRAFCDAADLVVADGMPLIWMSRLQATPLPERVAGSYLIHSVTAAAAGAGLSMFFLGGDEGVAERAAERLTGDHRGLRVAGTHFPPIGFEDSPEEMDRIIEALRRARPAIVVVGLPFPKQERLIEQLRVLMPDTWFLGLGIAMGFVSGDARRAPAWTHGAGLEWAYRLLQDPKRLFDRYVKRGIPFALRCLAACTLRGVALRLVPTDLIHPAPQAFEVANAEHRQAA